MTRIPRMSVSVLVFAIVLLGALAAQQMKARLGEEEAAAVDAMLKFLYPNLTTYWDTDVFVQDPSGNRARIALTYLAKLSDAPLEFAAGVQESDANANDVNQIRRGKAVSVDHRPRLIAVARDQSGVFRLVASSVLEPSHMYAGLSSLNNDPANSSIAVVSYKTVDLHQDKVVEVSWDAAMDTNLKLLRKRPTGVEIRAKASKSWERVLFVYRTPTGIQIMDPATNSKTELPCAQICEPSLQDLTGSN
jgi:hypothetical protein